MAAEHQIELVWRKTLKPETADRVYEKPEYVQKTITKGWRLQDDYASFEADTIFEKDVEIKMRDGCKILVDIFRPAEAKEALPALVAWSPYGKAACRNGGFNPIDATVGHLGIPRNRLSAFEKFEAPDPAEWTARGYAIVNPDPRGVYDSECNLHHFGEVEANDGYDTIEEVAAMPWCNGKVALVGNSWLAISQWFIAAQQPPHLACIAPFEGAGDLYRDLLCRGGVPQTGFWNFLSNQLRGRNLQENVIGMLKKYPQMNDYWSKKRADMSRIKVPAYILASYSSILHTFGSFRGFMEIPHDKKWLRVHHTQEWHDLYQKSTNDELQSFLDLYTKGISNGWDKTPQVRVSLLRFNKEAKINQVFNAWPIPETEYRTLYLSGDSTLWDEAPSEEATLSYLSSAPSQQANDDPEELSLTYTFSESCVLAGCARAVLYMYAEEANDMDVFVQIRKMDSQGNLLRNLNIPHHDLELSDTSAQVDLINPNVYLGPSGCLRASYRAIDEALSTSWWPEHDFRRQKFLEPGEVVRLEIGLWQTGIVFEKGEKLVLKVAGHDMRLAEFPELRGAQENSNVGKHLLLMGPTHSSHLIIPTVPNVDLST